MTSQFLFPQLLLLWGGFTAELCCFLFLYSLVVGKKSRNPCDFVFVNTTLTPTQSRNLETAPWFTKAPKFNSKMSLKSYRNPISERIELPVPAFFRGELFNFGGYNFFGGLSSLCHSSSRDLFVGRCFRQTYR